MPISSIAFQDFQVVHGWCVNFYWKSLVVIMRGTGRLDCQVMDDQGFTPAMLLDSFEPQHWDKRFRLSLCQQGGYFHVFSPEALTSNDLSDWMRYGHDEMDIEMNWGHLKWFSMAMLFLKPWSWSHGLQGRAILLLRGPIVPWAVKLSKLLGYPMADPPRLAGWNGWPFEWASF